VVLASIHIKLCEDDIHDSDKKHEQNQVVESCIRLQR
jgi:hypothetical protein